MDKSAEQSSWAENTRYVFDKFSQSHGFRTRPLEMKNRV